MTTYNRRQFLGVLGAGAVAGAGISQPASAQETPVVKMGNNYFDPIGLHVEPGTTVRFEIAAGAHSATAYPDRVPADGTAFDSGTISQGSFEHTFESPGTYDYYCIPHKTVGMVGRIVVDSPGGPAEESSIPDGEVPDSETIVQNGAVAIGSDVDGSGSTDGGMMGGSRGGWGGVPFVGGALGMLGLVGGLLYWALSGGDAPPESDDSAMETLQRRYARGEIDEGEFQRRRERLETGGDDTSQ
ncbi:plastocyanin/azurin family copper-binding protein [Haloarcula nitratireducens]|uniref:SHOCT domain-containing protein n=1 Tax=Haloarcula nitratireducens TaxID=2487749 RepID=A0AAW4PJC0_9EURY|nr:plastocyanin/azurin family copper-binding protein [Halomicroarcula nitratireducens]MBX0298140.1 SHOCT domain-containing protein [Halomicroarcula nitratireducens]